METLVSQLAVRDHLTKNEKAPDFTLVITPGMHLPTDPVNCAVGARELILLAFFHGAGQTTPVYFFPSVRNLGEDLVMVAADDDVPVP
jgi:hypothetical protein